MKISRRLAAATVVAALAAAISAVALQLPAAAHGSLQIPGSRNWLCYEDGLTPQGNIVPNNPACAAAIAKQGTTSLYNWFAELRSDGNGRGQGFIPDGQLCSAGAINFDFSGFDLARSDWPVTHLTAGASIQFRYNMWAAHPGWFYLYVTKDTWNPNAPLTWDELEPAAFSSADHPPSVGSPGNVSSYYYWTGNLPQKTGRHLIYSIWQRSDSQETFYGCSDVVFDGGNGQVTGVGPGSGGTGSPTASPTPTRSSTPSPSPSVTPSRTPSATPSRTPSATPSRTTGGGTGCAAAYQVTSSWSGGFQAGVTVTNNGAAAISSWTVHWTFSSGETIAQIWNATGTQSGTGVTAKSLSYNGALGPNASTTFGLLGNGNAGTVTGVTCTSP